MRRPCAFVVSGSVTLATLAVLSGNALGSRRPSRADVTEISQVLGLQGTAGAGSNVPIVFLLADRRPRRVDVEVEYGIDRNLDGTIGADEFRPASEDRLDPRNTRSNEKPQLFRAGTGRGAQHSYVWNSFADLGIATFRALEFVLTSDGRMVPDPQNPGSFLLVTGPGGLPILGGVQVRMRATRGRTRRGAWAVSAPFALDNDQTPSMTLGAFESGPQPLVHWTAFDGDSEDRNGNGQLDLADGEDANGNGLLDDERVGVAFDYHRLAPGENPAILLPVDLIELDWAPCSRLAGSGDNVQLDARPGVPVPRTGPLSGVASAPPGVGRSWTFAWDAATDVGSTSDGFIFRARPFDEHRGIGATVYSRTIVRTQP